MELENVMQGDDLAVNVGNNIKYSWLQACLSYTYSRRLLTT